MWKLNSKGCSQEWLHRSGCTPHAALPSRGVGQRQGRMHMQPPATCTCYAWGRAASGANVLAAGGRAAKRVLIAHT